MDICNILDVPEQARKYLGNAEDTDEDIILALHKLINQEVTPKHTKKWILDLK